VLPNHEQRASQFNHAPHRRALASSCRGDGSLGLIRPRERLRYRWQLLFPEVFASSLRPTVTRPCASASPSKPVRPHGEPLGKDKAQIGPGKAGRFGELGQAGGLRAHPLHHAGMTGPSELPNKKDVARSLLLKGSVFVHLDPRIESVLVPEWLKRQPQLVLQVGLDMQVPIPDLRMDDVGVFGTLSFNRTAFTCVVPWEAVFAVVGDDGRGMVWPGSMPREIAAEVEREAQRAGRVSEAAAGEGGRDAERKPRRRARRVDPAAAPARAPAIQTARVKPPKPQALEVIAGKGTGSTRSDALRRERRELPSYLRVVK
jgi:hypothetical protein